ncbi:glycosyl hydrolase 53 family protein [Clostridium hydrogenum]|uniref:glycosyl hydrolase 53 family protein n=1 Tax=Clostridium hydrogenum TaxID=2855764 RepID=UPI001F30DBE5|nr:glycosyl hydrolase 53 family protein [Clostridium hydrogenum]
MIKKKILCITLAATLTMPVSAFCSNSINVKADAVTNYTSQLQSTKINIPPIKNLSPDFIKGMDVSMLKEIEDDGGKYYDNLFDANGNPKSEDCLKILKAHGVNWVRLRIWNNPTGAGGENNLDTTINLAARAKALGLKVLLDFHYSDTWADAGTQTIPSAWTKDTKEATGSYTALENDVYNFTKDTLTTLKNNNALPDMVQIGNEINGGMLWPDGQITGTNSGGYDELARLLNSGSKAVREVQDSNNKIKIVLHLAKGGDNEGFTNFFDAMTQRNVDFDVIGLSFYPYWHGSVQSLQDNVNKLSVRYPSKQFVIAETAYAFTNDDSDGFANNFGPAQELAGVFPATVQGQATEVRTMMNVMAQLPNNRGLGVFYWEGDWIPVKGAGWISGQGNAWENQAMFDFKGNALPSLDVFNQVSSSATVDPIVISIPKVSIDGFVGSDPTSKLPSTVTVVYSDGTMKSENVAWDKISASDYGKEGTFTVSGTVDGTTVKAAADVKMSSNLMQNGGFETGDTSGWQITGDDANDGVIKMDSWTADGGKYTLNSWKATPLKYNVSQSFENIPNGTYVLKAWVVGSGDGKSNVKLFASGFGDKDTTLDVSKYSSWTQVTLGNINVTNGKCTVGMNVDAAANTWWDLDGVEFSRVTNTTVTSIKQPYVEGVVGTDPTSKLPATVDVSYSDGSTQTKNVTWDKISASDYAKAGTFNINGTVDGTDVKAVATIKMSNNVLQNGGFETGDTSGWQITGDNANDGTVKMDSWTGDGGKYTLNSWNKSAFNYKVSQTVNNLPNGIYTLKAWVVGSGDGISDVKLFASGFGDKDLTLDVSKYSSWTQVTIGNIKVTNGKCTVGMNVNALPNTWWDLDGVDLEKTGDLIVVPSPISSTTTSANQNQGGSAVNGANPAQTVNTSTSTGSINKNLGTLPKTGSSVDFSVLAELGMICIALGGAIVTLSKKIRRKRIVK